ncbi:esterase-like activity of phytase family protein [Psychrobacter sp. AOP22-C1-22]|uniref:esterase-like activity of phytase family protein n=1 Tax=unclassified Psychrobacter TaxID=196806 RepID=UPI001788A0A8|nr:MULTISPECIES: esterase-like activity of phytase family protein [unclassified Psychrobacter]MDN5801558.1 esterase-like activity of phytase family protein [Psychrobacter sp.]MBE0407497.1 esterase-like activity of phytase family protein [Psychrobacter sp. FME6]MBE0444910.1 esterase-like activity of phytase family protein [Psychrobacter sp. FME5]MDN5891452.1 esterase-like activity of phytase family protein [Psychrobacter sp.]MDN5897126.1 esterase-like activity of phytase family protein [Psychro
MLKQNSNNMLMSITDFPQGSPLPYTVLDATLTNAAYPEQKLEIRGGGYGSDAAAHPTNANQFYALADRGPNADFDGVAGKGKQFLVPNYTPSIGLFELQADGKITKIKEIILKDSTGNPISGLPNPKALGGTNEVPYDVNGQPMTINPSLPFDTVTNPIKTDINGLDPEGLTALTDGSFWISDEYGPHLVHYDAEGIEVERINPFANDERNNVMVDGKPVLLPAEFTKRRTNRGMEALTVTPDQTTLVGIMESSMDNPDQSGRLSNLTRMVTVNLVSGQIKQYLYRLDAAQHVASGIVAINEHEFYLIEHDRKFPLQDKSAQKLIYKVDTSQATDIETILDNKSVEQDEIVGLTIEGQTLEQLIATDEKNWQALEEMAIKPVSKTLVVDVLATIDYPHDKLEGLWLRQDGSLGLLNDDDFSITDTEIANPKSLVEHKYLDKEKTIIDANRLYIVMPTE